jgi:hypothetical protein
MRVFIDALARFAGHEWLNPTLLRLLAETR